MSYENNICEHFLVLIFNSEFLQVKYEKYLKYEEFF